MKGFTHTAFEIHITEGMKQSTRKRQKNIKEEVEIVYLYLYIRLQGGATGRVRSKMTEFKEVGSYGEQGTFHILPTFSVTCKPFQLISAHFSPAVKYHFISRKDSNLKSL